MQFSIRALPLAQLSGGVKTGCLVLAVHAGGILSRSAQLADKATGGALRRVLAKGDLAGKAGATLLLQGVAGLAAERVLLVSLGELGEFGVNVFREALRGVAAALKSLGAKDATVFPADFSVSGRGLPWTVRSTVLVLREAFYRFDQLKTQKKPAAPALQAVTLAIAGAPVTLQVQAASDRPLLNQITISESRQLRFSASNTVTNNVSDNRTGSRLRAEKPRNATTASEGILPPAACPSSRIRRVVSAIRNSERKTATARLANSRSSVRRKIMRYWRRNS